MLEIVPVYYDTESKSDAKNDTVDGSSITSTIKQGHEATNNTGVKFRANPLQHRGMKRFVVRPRQ